VDNLDNLAMDNHGKPGKSWKTNFLNFSIFPVFQQNDYLSHSASVTLSAEEKLDKHFNQSFNKLLLTHSHYHINISIYKLNNLIAIL